MWILSQDGKTLVKAEIVDIADCEYIRATSGKPQVFIGKYTEERAVIVLEWIFEHIGQDNAYPFRMPKE